MNLPKLPEGMEWHRKLDSDTWVLHDKLTNNSVSIASHLVRDKGPDVVYQIIGELESKRGVGTGSVSGTLDLNFKQPAYIEDVEAMVENNRHAFNKLIDVFNEQIEKQKEQIDELRTRIEHLEGNSSGEVPF